MKYLAFPVLGLMLFPHSGWAASYQADLSLVREDEDLQDLYTQGDLTPEELDTLRQLLDDPINVNRADRDTLTNLPGITFELADQIITTREGLGDYAVLADLMKVPGITEEMVRQLSPFAQALPPLLERLPLRGTVKARTAQTWGNKRRPGSEDAPYPGPNTIRDYRREQGYPPLPEAYVRVRATVDSAYDVGLVMLEQEAVSAWLFDPAEQEFLVNWGYPTFTVNKAYVATQRPRWSAIVGSYGIGFGQGVVIDNTHRTKPRGWYKDDLISGSNNFGASERMFGAAASFKGGLIGPTWLTGTAFVSYQRYDLYQYDFQLIPPAADDGEELLTPHAQVEEDVYFNYVTFPRFYGELIGGAHLQLAPGSERNRLGITTWGAHVETPVDMVFTNKMPNRPNFGCVGADFGAGLGHWDLKGEAAVMDNGAAGFYARNTMHWKRGEVGLDLRRYGENFDNPHSSAPSGSDSYSPGPEDEVDPSDTNYLDDFGGDDRDRDEQGFKLDGDYSYKRKIYVRGSWDQWQNLSTNIWDLDTRVRADYRYNRQLDFGILASYKNKDLSTNGHELSFAETVAIGEEPASAQTQPAGSQIKVGGEVKTTYVPNTTLRLYYARTYEDDNRVYYLEPNIPSTGYRVGQYIQLQSTVILPMDLTGNFRLRYQDQDIYGDAGDRLLGFSANLAESLQENKYKFGLRYALEVDLPDPPDEVLLAYEPQPSTTTWPAGKPVRTPGQMLTLTFETRF